MNKNECIYDEAVVIFERSISDLYNSLVLKPVKIVNGYMVEQYDMFIDKDNNSYSHYINEIPGNVYGLRIGVTELLRKYRTDDYNIAKKRWLRDLKKYEYVIGFCIDDDKKKIRLVGINLFNDKNIFFPDIDLEKFSIIEYGDAIKNEDNMQNKVLNTTLLNVSEIASDIKKTIVGQDEAIDKLLTTLWTNSQTEHKDNIIMIGATGNGKTAILNAVAKKLNRQMYITTIVGTTESGYVGKSVTDIIKELIIACNNDFEKATNAIVVLDEFDKLSKSKGGQVATESVQNELLTLIETGEFLVTIDDEEILFPTKDITFIGLGNFYGITKKSNKEVGFGKDILANEKSYQEVTKADLIKYGFIPDLIGRMPVIITLNSLTIKNYVSILKDSSSSILNDRLDILNKCNVTVVVTDDAYLKMAELAEQSLVGARELNNIVNNTLSCILREVAFGINDYNYVIVTADTVMNPNIYIKKTVNDKENNVKKRVKNEKFRSN